MKETGIFPVVSGHAVLRFLERCHGLNVEAIRAENLPWAMLIERYDREGMLFYLPPGNEGDYGAGVFRREDFEQMAEVLKRLRGRFILSLNAAQGVFETFRSFAIEEVDCTYSVSGGAGKKVREVIISSR